MKTVKESLQTASMKYAEIKEDADLEEETYFNPHKIALMRAYEAGFKFALITISGFVDATVKEL